jgi:hypothetical protein
LHPAASATPIAALTTCVAGAVLAAAVVYILYSIHSATVLDDNRSTSLPGKVNDSELVEPYGMPDRAAKAAAPPAQASG